MTVTFNSSRIGVTSAIPFHEVTKPAISPTEAPHQPSTCSKTLRATNRQKIEFTYSLQDKTVSAQILSKGRSIPIAPENLPQELRSLPSAQAFLLYLTHSSAHVTRLGDGENRIYLNGRLLGGISYQEALANLTNHLNELANPYLRKDVVERLEDLSRKIDIASCPLIKSFEDLLLPDDAKRYLTNLSEEISLTFQDLTLPDETRRFLTTLSEEIIRRVTAHVNADVKDVNSIKQVIESIQTDLSLFSPLKEKEADLTPALKVFFQLKATKKLNNEDIFHIKQLIIDNRVEDLRETVSRLFISKGANLSEVNSEIEQTVVYVDLDTLLGEAIEETPKSKNGLDIYWNESPPFFVGKTLYLTDPITFYTHNGKIMRAQKKMGDWIFELQDRSEVHVADNRTVKIIYKTLYEFWRGLTKVFERGSILNIEPVCLDVHTPLIREGRYILGHTEAFYPTFPAFSDSHSRTFLLDFSTRQPLYSLTAYYQGNSFQKPFKVDITDLQTAKTTASTVNELNSTLNLIGTEVKPIDGITALNLDEKILIKNEIDENEEKLKRLQVIERERAQLQDDLQKEENRAVFEALLDDLVEQNFATGNIDLLTAQKPNLADQLNGIVRNYLQTLQQAIDPGQLLKELLLDANYTTLVAGVIEENLKDDKKKNVLSIAHTMSFLKDAFQHIRKLSRRELIFFMGNTGSGKSTAVNYFLKTPLKKIRNTVGEEAFEVDSAGRLPTDFPRIGQSIGNSETLYTQAYPLKDSSIMLVDCPGFKDTRGQKHELCTTLSIDRAIQESDKIKSIVITVPIHSFLDEKGNRIVELIETVKERFPLTFNPDSMKDSSHVFLLITKSQQSQSETVKKLADGTRIQSLFNSSQEHLANLLRQKQDGAKDIDSDIEKTRSRSRIWQALRTMQTNRQFDFIDIKNKSERQLSELLGKYSQPGEVDKSQYAPLMTGGTMQLKFGEYIELSTNTWAQHIFREYLFSIPGSIRETENELTTKKGELEQYKKEKEEQQAKALALAENQNNLRELIAQLEGAQAQPETLVGTLRAELQRKVKEVNKDAKKRIREGIHRSNNAIFTAEKRVINLRAKATQLQENIQKAEGRIKHLQEEIQRLETGTTSISLHEISYQPDRRARIRFWKAGAREECYNEFRSPENQDFEEEEKEVNVSDFRGFSYKLIYIEKEYKIVPTDPELRAAFAERNRGGQFEAILEGRKFNLDMARKASDTGLRVLYPFTLTFDGDGLPEIKITHTIPNTEYNAATIRNHNGEINLLRQQLAQDQGDLNGIGQVRGKLRETEEAIQELSRLKERKQEQEEALEQLEKQAQEEKIEEMLQQKKAEDENLTREKNTAEDTTAIDNNIRVIEGEISALESKKKGLEKKKRNFAIIIKFQEETAKLLRELAELIVFNGGKEVLQRNQTIRACRNYITMYDTHIDEIRALCMSELPTE